MKRVLIVASMLVICACRLYAQTYTPIAVTGFNNDGVAETGINAEAVTTTGLDIQQKILYTFDFAAANGLQAGVPNDGLFTTGLRTYQMNDYTANNVLYMSKLGSVTNTVGTGTLTFTTPGAYSKISLLCFSTEQGSTLGITFNYTDGTTSAQIVASILDWFGGIDPVFDSYGRIQRLPAGPYNVEGLSSNDPRIYSIDIAPACENQSKEIASITIEYLASGAPSGVSRAVFLAVSGQAYVPVTVTSDVTKATCGNSDGSISITATGGAFPLTYSWNTTPVQTTETATDLPAGSYTCTVTDANGCPSDFSADISEESMILLKALAKPGDICSGTNTKLYAIPTGGSMRSYTWEPGNITDSSFTVAPDTTTTFKLTGEDQNGCHVIDSIKVTVTKKPAAPLVSAQSICPDSTAVLKIDNATTPFTYNWYTYPSGGDVEGQGATYTTPAVSTETTWYVEAVNGPCSSDRTAVTVTPYDRAITPVVKAGDITTSGVTFTWDPVPGATGYIVSVDGGAYITPSSGNTGTSHVVTGITNQESISIKVIALGPISCQNSLPGLASAKPKPGEIFIPNAFTPNGDGKNDYFKPEGTTISAIDMKVFNQWGELIYRTNQLTGWNGTYNGKLQPTGVYTYTVRITLNNKTELTRKGSINLLR
ncbi:gliding motility-associated C-terminal domain-containing protein [Chitinophaga filiformis]|uniref:Gliding motility-associated C-terminal domain-containing protein n=1 Tax=Chitinophaga filiformis TaxID=104663 RepID=A0ABY4I8C8_CHIFI|nr:gliding motility-associated C-terminal domain-containing protein [Chitinophaga filiformis]UPK72152.1 gliding motility-associated C-terminal domain-containing protein [Chitinophaga filiformis]